MAAVRREELELPPRRTNKAIDGHEHDSSAVMGHSLGIASEDLLQDCMKLAQGDRDRKRRDSGGYRPLASDK